jgi:hypothetical protein
VEVIIKNYTPKKPEIKEIFNSNISLAVKQALKPLEPKKSGFFRFLVCGFAKPKKHSIVTK